MSSWRYWMLANSFLQDGFDTWTTKAMDQKLLCNWHCEKLITTFHQKVPSVEEKKSIFFSIGDSNTASFWMTKYLLCFCRVAKTILGWWEIRHELIWKVSLVDRELCTSHLKLSDVRRKWNHFDLRSTGGVRSCLAFWLCFFFLSWICMCDCLGKKKKTHTTETEASNTGWYIAPSHQSSHMQCKQSEVICYFPGFHYVYVFI